MSLDVLNLLAVFVAALLGGWAARRLGYPSILGELAAGIVLGPPLLGLLQPDDALAVIGKLGVVLLMLYIGIHLDPTSIGKAAKPGALAALGGFIVPAGLGFGLMMLVDGDPISAAFVAVAMGVTSLATKSRVLVDLGILNTRIAHVLMAGALVSDVVALVIFAGLLGFAASGSLAIGSFAVTGALTVAFLAVAWLVGSRVLPHVGRWLSNKKMDPSIRFLIVVSIGLAFAAVADAVGLHAILGSFIAGLFIREGVLPRDQLADLEAKTRLVSVGFLAPVFFVTAGFDVSFSVFTTDPLLLAGVVVLATVGKIVGTALFYLPTGHGFREGIAVGAGMNGRGAVEIIVAELALIAGIIDTTTFSILVFMAIFTTATVPVLLTRSIEWLRARGELTADVRSGVIVVGAAGVARRLAMELGGPDRVTLIDTSTAHRIVAESAGFTVVEGSALDADVLDRAGAREASTIAAVTGNDEVNVLAVQLAARRFGIPHLHVALSVDAPSSLLELVEALHARLLFGRAVDLPAWDVGAEDGSLSEVEYPITDVGIAITERGMPDEQPSRMLVLPLAVLTRDGRVPFDAGRPLEPGDVVYALGRQSTEGRTRVTGLHA